MKRIIAVCMVMLMVLSACSSKQDSTTVADNGGNEGNTVNTAAGDNAVNTDNSADGDAAAEVTPEATPEPTAEPTATPVPEPERAAVTLNLPGKYSMNTKGEQGTIEKISYMAHDYLGDGSDYEKFAYVYLPAGYDETKQYNVIYLMHGIGGNENEWGLNQAKTSKVKKILDNLIADGDIEPVIVVTPNGKALALSGVEGNDLFYKFGYELRNDLIPYMESHYATYAEYSEDGYDLTANRNHRAMAGLSMGGMQTINIGICECLDLFSWFGAFSAAPTSYAAGKISATIKDSEYDIDFFYNICGKQDSIAYGSSSAAAKTIDTVSDKLTKRENFLWQEKSGGHDFNIWYLGLYNFALIAFNDDIPLPAEE